VTSRALQVPSPGSAVPPACWRASRNSRATPGFHRIPAGASAVSPPVEREPAAGLPVRPGNRPQDGRDRPPAGRMHLVFVPAGQLRGDLVRGQPLARPVHHQVKNELPCRRQISIESLCPGFVAVFPFLAGMALASRMPFPERIIISKHHQSVLPERRNHPLRRQVAACSSAMNDRPGGHGATVAAWEASRRLPLTPGIHADPRPGAHRPRRPGRRRLDHVCSDGS
jgi:hypothetical protein